MTKYTKWFAWHGCDVLEICTSMTCTQRHARKAGSSLDCDQWLAVAIFEVQTMLGWSQSIYDEIGGTGSRQCGFFQVLPFGPVKVRRAVNLASVVCLFESIAWGWPQLVSVNLHHVHLRDIHIACFWRKRHRLHFQIREETAQIAFPDLSQMPLLQYLVQNIGTPLAFALDVRQWRVDGKQVAVQSLVALCGPVDAWDLRYPWFIRSVVDLLCKLVSFWQSTARNL